MRLARPCARPARRDPLLCSAASASPRPSHGLAHLERGELELPTFAWAADSDRLDMATLASIAAGVSTRRYAGTLDELAPPQEALSVSKSAVSRRWVALSQAQLHEWLSGSIKELDLPVVMIDVPSATGSSWSPSGIDAQGNKHVLGLREGSTESTRVVRSLLAAWSSASSIEIGRGCG